MVDVRLETTGPWPAAFVRSGIDWVSVHSRRDPVAEADRVLAQHFPTGLPPTIAIAGLGLGFVLDALDRRGFAGRVVAAEPLADLTDALRSRPIPNAWIAAGRLTLVVAPAFDGRTDLWKAFGDDAGEPFVLVNPVLSRTCPLETAAARTMLERAAFAAKANAEAKRENAGRYLLNTLRNAPAIAAGGDAATLVGLFRGAPALLVAAGPSLDRNLPEIIRLHDRALVVAVDTALRPLLAAGVQPHLVVAVDPTEANARHLTDLPPCPGTYLVAEGSVDPEALRHFDGHTFFFRVGDHHPWPWLREQGIERGRLRAWGSVLTTAFDLALGMGCDPIVFAGADLAYTDGRPYARGTTFEEDWRREQAWGRTLEEIWRIALDTRPAVEEVGVGGHTVRTAPHLRAFRDWIATEAAKATGHTIVNATGAGVLVGDCIRQETLGQALREGPRGPTAVQDRIAAARRFTPAAARIDAARATQDVRLAWFAFASGGATSAAIDQALGLPGSAPIHTAPSVSATVERAPHERVLEACTALGILRGAGARGPDLAHVADLARTVCPQRVLAIGPGATPAALTALVAAGPNTTADFPSPEAAAAAVTIARTLDIDAWRIEQRSRAASLVVLACSDPASHLERQIADAWRSVETGGRLVVFDETGREGGQPIRRALLGFLESHPEVALHYQQYHDLDSRVSWLGDRRHMVSAGRDRDKALLTHSDIAARLARLLVEQYQPTSVLDVGCGVGYWLDAFRRLGVERVTGVEDADWLAHAGAMPVDSAVTAGDLATFSCGRVDLCVCVNVVQRVPDPVACAIVERCAAVSDTVVFAVPAVGLDLPGFVNERPWRVWHERFLDRGFVLHDELRPLIEARWGEYQSVYDLLVVYRRALAPGTVDTDPVRQALLESASRIDDLLIQAFWYRQRHTTIARVASAAASALPVTPVRSFVISPAAMRSAEGGARRYLFRTDAARLAAGCARRAPWPLREDQRVLTEISAGASPLAPGSFRIDPDGLTFTASDGSDPRLNGHTYICELPAHVAWLEQQTFNTAVREHL